MPKTFTKVPTAVLGFSAAQDVVLTNNNTGVGLVGYDGVFAKVIVGDLIKNLLADKIAAKIAAVMPNYSSGNGSVVRINPSTPKEGDLKTVKPVKDVNGVITSGQYEVHIYVNSAWRQIFPR